MSIIHSPTQGCLNNPLLAHPYFFFALIQDIDFTRQDFNALDLLSLGQNQQRTDRFFFFRILPGQRRREKRKADQNRKDPGSHFSQPMFSRQQTSLRIPFLFRFIVIHRVILTTPCALWTDHSIWTVQQCGQPISRIPSLPLLPGPAPGCPVPGSVARDSWPGERRGV